MGGVFTRRGRALPYCEDLFLKTSQPKAGGNPGAVSLPAHRGGVASLANPLSGAKLYIPGLGRGRGLLANG